MGEYATITRAGRRKLIKTGTGRSMYYLRYDQRDKAEPCADSIDFRKSIDSVWFRLPRIEEEGQAPGHFDYCGPFGAKPIRIFASRKTVDGKPNPAYSKYLLDLEAMARDIPGIIQLSTQNGVVVNVPCGHGHLIDLPKGMGYNGHDGNQLAAFAVGIREGAPAILVGCRYCRNALAWYDRAEFFETFEPFADESKDFDYLEDYVLKMERKEI